LLGSLPLDLGKWLDLALPVRFRRQCGVSRGQLAFHSFRKCFMRALELAAGDRDCAALVIGHERGFMFRVYNPEGLDLALLRQVVEAMRYERLQNTLTHGSPLPSGVDKQTPLI
jgi:hypothetical protein